MAQVFISYSRADLMFVEQLASDLKEAGFDVWYDLSGLEGGTRWSTEITKAIHSSQYVVVVLSPNSVKSEWVEREYLLAGNLRRPIVPLYYKACELPLGYLNLHYIDVQGLNYERNFPQILKALDDTPASLHTYVRSPTAPPHSPAEYPGKKTTSLAGFLMIGLFVAGIAILSYLIGSGKLKVWPAATGTSVLVEDTVTPRPPTVEVVTDTPVPVNTVIPSPKVKKENITNILVSSSFDDSLRNLAAEKYSAGDYVNRTEFTYTISLDRPGDVVWHWHWCAKDEAILIRNFEYIILSFTLNGEEIPQSELIEDQYSDNGSACRVYYVTLYDWPAGTHHLVNNVAFTQLINDGWDDYQPRPRTYEYLVYVKP